MKIRTFHEQDAMVMCMQTVGLPEVLMIVHTCPQISLSLWTGLFRLYTEVGKSMAFEESTFH